MGVMPVNKLLITMSLPMVISMLVQALYNIVDSVFVAQISENALTAVSLAFPIQSLMIAFSVGTGVGINALLSRSLGEKDTNTANLAAKNGLFLSVATYIVFAICGLFFSRLFYSVQTDNPEIIEYGTQYMFIVTVFSIGVFVQIALERLLQSTGRTIYNMYMQGAGAIINIVLDPILIFGLFGLPKMGVAGAAIATVIGQFCAMGLGIFYNHKKNHEIDVNMLHFRPHLMTIKNIYRVGFPSIIMQAVTSVMTFGINSILLMFSVSAVSVFGVYFKLQSFVFMPVFGLTNGMVPIVAYNYGAKDKKRIMKTIKLAAIIAMSIMLLGTAIFQIFPRELLQMFNASEEMMAVGVVALRIISISFVFAGFSIVTVSAFQALGDGVRSLIVSLVRQIVVILPASFILAKLFGLDALWCAFPLAEIIGFLMCLTMAKKMYNRKIKDL
ncbi:MAG: MATE family efflux transporter [Oscillospiraceae bacterium]